jgi:hypothetical protein
VLPCAQCKTALEDAAASISGGVMGDEYIESWYFCGSCGVYTLEIYRDRFCGEPSVQISGPVEKARGDAQIALIRGCPRAWDKNCRCPSHMTYFDGHLD